MAKISLCMIAKDEEGFIADAISSVSDIVDEIIVIDTGSTDNTIKAAKEFGAKVISEPWQDDFSKARNVSLKHATGDWILILDADEAVDQRDLKKIKALADAEDKGILGYILTQRTYTNNTKLKEYNAIKRSSRMTKGFSGWVPAKIVRMFRNNPKIRFEGQVHETVLPSIQKLKGKVSEADIPIHHYSTMKHASMPAAKKEKDMLYTKLGREKAKTGDAKALHELGKQHLENGEFDEACKNFQEALKARPDYAEAYADLGTALLKAGRLDDSKKALSKAINLGSESYDAFNNLGIVYAKLGRHKDAILLFMKAIELNQGFAAAYKNLGLSMHALGRKEEAKACFAVAVKLNPEYEKEIKFK